MRHAQYDAWLKARAQAHYRGEQYLITFEDWVELWGDNWSRRGRGADCLMLMKRRWAEPWTKRNAHLVDRPTFHARQAKIKENTISGMVNTRVSFMSILIVKKAR